MIYELRTKEKIRNWKTICKRCGKEYIRKGTKSQKLCDSCILKALKRCRTGRKKK